jgi:hypothetical protein
MNAAPLASPDRDFEPPLSQVAFSVDLAATERWFREALGFWPVGGSRAMMHGPLASAVQASRASLRVLVARGS